MQPLVKGALAVAALAALSALAPAAVKGRPAPPSEKTTADTELMKMPCGAREIPEGEACVPVPELAASADGDDAQPTDDVPLRLPRRPDRPAKVSDLLLPIPGEPPLLAIAAASGDADDRSVLALGAPLGTPAHAVALEGQDGPFEVLGVERLPGRGLVVAALATIASASAAPAKQPRGKARGAGKKRDGEAFVVLFGSLDGAGPGLEKGQKLEDGAVVGFAGDAANGEPGVRFEARRLRPGTDPHATPLARLVSDAESIATDARNVLPPKTKAPAASAPPPREKR